uniref:Reverse transcriptase domain-containing protein n=1 Tax=Haemonchus contortus TaxID=6289 RepID=A0A7I4Z469_HAECO
MMMLKWVWVLDWMRWYVTAPDPPTLALLTMDSWISFTDQKATQCVLPPKKQGWIKEIAKRKHDIYKLHIYIYITGRSYELAETLERRRIDFCAVQETRWSCCKSRDIGPGFEAVLFGGPKTTSGVGIIVSERFRDSIVSVERFDDRLMKIVVVIERQKIPSLFSVAPQTGCSEQTKDTFWNLLDGKTAEVLLQEAIVVAGDLNGHVGATKDGYSCHGGFGYGSRNTDAERVLEYADSHNLTIVNTRFRKRDSHLITFYSGENRTQIDFVLVRHRDQGLVTDAKTVPYEAVATQHRPLICTLKSAPPKPKIAESILLPAVTTVDKTRKGAAEAITRVARSKLGVTKPGRRKLDKQTWLWTDNVRDKVREKKKQYHAFVMEKMADNWQRYQIAKKKAKKAVASEKAAHYADLNKKLESRDGERLGEGFRPRDVIRYALRQHGVPEELIEWVRILYTSPKSRAQTAASTSTELPISVGVHQGSALSPLLFVVVMDAITKDLQKPAPWTLLYADDVMLASEDKSELESQVQTWSDRLAIFGLRLNVKKTEYLTTDSSELGSIKINGTELTRTTTFKYLGSAIASDGSLGFETKSRVNAAWSKWRSMTGLLCDKNIPERLKSKIYRTVIRPVAIYGAECWL